MQSTAHFLSLPGVQNRHMVRPASSSSQHQCRAMSRAVSRLVHQTASRRQLLRASHRAMRVRSASGDKPPTDVESPPNSPFMRIAEKMFKDDKQRTITAINKIEAKLEEARREGASGWAIKMLEWSLEQNNKNLQKLLEDEEKLKEMKTFDAVLQRKIAADQGESERQMARMARDLVDREAPKAQEDIKELEEQVEQMRALNYPQFVITVVERLIQWRRDSFASMVDEAIKISQSAQAQTAQSSESSSGSGEAGSTGQEPGERSYVVPESFALSTPAELYSTTSVSFITIYGFWTLVVCSAFYWLLQVDPLQAWTFPPLSGESVEQWLMWTLPFTGATAFVWWQGTQPWSPARPSIKGEAEDLTFVFGHLGWFGVSLAALLIAGFDCALYQGCLLNLIKGINTPPPVTNDPAVAEQQLRGMLGSIVEFRPLPSFLNFPMLSLEVGAVMALLLNLFKAEVSYEPELSVSTDMSTETQTFEVTGLRPQPDAEAELTNQVFASMQKFGMGAWLAAETLYTGSLPFAVATAATGYVVAEAFARTQRSDIDDEVADLMEQAMAMSMMPGQEVDAEANSASSTKGQGSTPTKERDSKGNE